MRCPKCGGEHCQLITESTSNFKGFGVGKGCLGYLCLGPIGILCGMCGMGKGKTYTAHFWVCSDCGNKFRA